MSSVTSPTSRGLIDYLEFPFTKFVEGMKLYKGLYGDPWVNYDFTFPVNEPHIPIELQGFPLGQKTKQFRSLMKKKHIKKEVLETYSWKVLESTGFVLSYYEQKSLVVLNSFLTYHEMYGNTYVKRSFHIPKDPEILINGRLEMNPWPRAAWGMHLGKTVNRIKYGKAFRSIHSYLQVLDFPFHKLTKFWTIENITKSLQTYKQIHGNIKVPLTYAVPSGMGYPEAVHGMRLGFLLHHIRYNNYHAAHVETLKSIGLNLDIKKTKRRIVVPIAQDKEEERKERKKNDNNNDNNNGSDDDDDDDDSDDDDSDEEEEKNERKR